MKNIIVLFWDNKNKTDLPYIHGQEFEYSEKELNDIIIVILNKGYSILLKPCDFSLNIWVGRDNFRINN